MVILFGINNLSENVIFYYYPILFYIPTVLLYILWYFGFLMLGVNTSRRNNDRTDPYIKYVIPTILVTISVFAFVLLSALNVVSALSYSRYSKVSSCNGYDIASRGIGFYSLRYYGIKEYNVAKISASYVKDCQSEITLRIIEGNNSKNAYFYASPFATQAQIANTPEVKSILDSNPNARITEYEQGDLVIITIK